MSDKTMDLTNELRAALRALLNNPSRPAISADHAKALIALGLAAQWGSRVVITLAGRLAAFPPESERTS